MPTSFSLTTSSLHFDGRVKNPESIISAVWVNLAFSWQGLKALGIPDAELQNFPDDFKTGMKGRAGIIGDVGNSAPDNWLDPFKDPANIHALLIVAADHSQELAQKVHDVTRTAKFNAGVEVVFSQPGITRLDQPGHEHFGFKDGISQPGVRGVDPPDDPIGNPNQGHPGQDLLWPGEFVLGYDHTDFGHRSEFRWAKPRTGRRQQVWPGLDEERLLSCLPPLAPRRSGLQSND